jgi:hypothetical protein
MICKEKTMNNERILSYQTAKKLSEKEIADVAAAIFTPGPTQCTTLWNPQDGVDLEFDI